MSSESTTTRADLLDTSAAGPAAARGGALRAAGFAVGTLLSVVSVPLMIRHLGVEGFGHYVTVVSLVAIVAGLSEAGVAAIALREFVTRSGADRDRVMRDLLGIRIALGGAGVLAGVVFAIVAGYDRVLVIGTIAAGGAMLLTSVQTLLGVSLQATLRFGWVTVNDLLRQVLTVVVVVALVLAGSALGLFFWSLVLVSLIPLVLTAVLVRRIMPLRPSFHPARWWPLLRDTAVYAAAVALNAAYFRIAVVALSLLATERQTGYFATAFRVIEVLVAVPALVVGAAFPILTRAARDDRERLDSAAGRLIEVGLIMGIWIALGVALAAEPIISILAGDESGPSVALLQILALAMIPTFPMVAGGFTLLSLRCHREILIANGAALAASLVAAVMLIPAYDATGAAVAVMIAELTLMTFVLGALVRSRPSIARGFVRLPAIVAAGAASGVLALVPGLPPLVTTALAISAFPALLVLVRRFPPEIGDALRGRSLAQG